MSLRTLVTVALMAIAVLAAWAWSRYTTPPTPAPPAASGAAPEAASRVVVENGGDPGIEWQVPGRWGRETGHPVRLATYVVPAVAADRDSARCAVFYFGPGQGGDARTNIERWISELETPGTPQRTSRTIDGLAVSIVRARGTYLAHSGMGEDVPAQEHYELYGAIVDGPLGPVFFKFTGPEKTVDAAAADFDRMLGTLRKKSAP